MTIISVNYLYIFLFNITKHLCSDRIRIIEDNEIKVINLKNCINFYLPLK